MIRSLVISLAALALFGSTALANEVTLRSSIIVEDRYVTLGDLFGLPGEKALTRVAHAPLPGKRSKLDASWLYRVARAHKINWRPLSLKTNVIVERASQQIYRDDIHAAILVELKEKGIGSDIEVSFSGRTRPIHLPTDVAPTIGIDHLVHDDRTGRFVATVSAPANDPAARRHRFAGQVHKLVSIPVVAKRMRRGDIIQSHHIAWKSVRDTAVRRDTVIEEEGLIGMAVKRVLREHTAIKLSYIQKPVLVNKNGLVTIILSSKMMTLTAQGKALQSGSRGDTVQVKNVQSDKLVEAIVTGTGEVSVSSAQRLALN